MSTKKLKDSHWAEIANDISKLGLLGRDLQDVKVDSDGDEDVGGSTSTRRVNPRARIDID